MSLLPPGEDPGSRYGEPRLNQRARRKVGPGQQELQVFSVEEESGTLNIRCKVCEMTVYGIRNLNSHIEGKKHSQQFSSLTWELLPEGEDGDSLSLQLPEPVSLSSAPSLDTDKVSLLPEDHDLAKFLHEYRNKRALLGLEYLVELQESETDLRGTRAINYCLLCDEEWWRRDLVKHMTSPSHRLAYLDSFFPTVRRKFCRVPNLRLWEHSPKEYLETVVTTIEGRCGRLRPLLVIGREYFETEMKLIKATVENGKHFKETVGLNFRSLLDPLCGQ